MDSVQEIEAIEDWDNYKGLDVEDEKPLGVSFDIKGDLENVLRGELRFNGSFAHQIKYPDALNPCLHLDGLGPIGLPLSEREAREIIGQSASTRNSDGKDVIWSFPGDKVRFDNPGWEAWIKDTVGPAMNAALDTRVSLTVVQYKLKSLTLRGRHTNSIDCFEEIRDDSQQYGTLSVILPSHHVGGQVHIIHEGTTKTFNTEGHSAPSLTAIAAYTAVSQRLDPIHSGYVACLCYELAFLGKPQSIPRLPDLGRAMMRLRRVFRSWRLRLDYAGEDEDDEDEDSEFDEDEAPPECVACFFHHTYDDGTANFKAVTLRGPDLLMLKHIAPLAKAYGFNLHLAHVTYKERGHASVDSVRSTRFGRCGGCSDHDISDCDEDFGYWSDTVDVNKLCMDDEVESTEVDLSILALDGMPMQMSGTTIEAIMEDKDGHKYFTNGRLDDGEKTPSFERQRRTWGTLTYSYNRCALIITPEDSATVDFAVGDVREFACMALKSSTSETPTAKEQRLVEALLAWLTKNRTVATTEASVLAVNSTVAKVLRDSAVRWNSADLFLKTLEGCGLDQCVKVAGIDVLLSGYRSFDWGIFKAVYSEILSKTMSITLRARLIDDILATGQSDSDVLSWCETQKQLALDTFQKLDVSGIDWIMKVVQSKQDPTDYLRTVLIPRLHSVQPYNLQVWTALLTYVEKCPSESPAWTGAEHLEIISACLGRVASEMPPYRTAKQKTYSNPPYTLVPTVDPILSILEMGTRFNCFQVCLTLLHNMFLQREGQKTAHPKRLPNQYYSALVPKVDKFLQAKPELSQFLEPFFSQAASVLLSSNSTLTTFTQELRTALLRSRDAIKILQTFLTADRVKALVAGQGVSLKYLSTFMSENLRSQADSSESLTTLQGMLKLCLTGMIGSFNQSSLTNYYRSNDGIELLTHCFTLQLSSDVDQVLARFLALPLSNEPGYIQNGLVSLLKHLPKFLTTQQLSLLDAPFSTFAAEIAKKFVRYTIGTRPSQVVSLRELQAVGCGCEPCRTSLVPFLTNDLPKVDIRVTAATQTHLEHQLMFAKKWGFTWTTIRQGTLQVVKPQRMIDVGRWAGAQTRGYAFLGLLGDDQQQRQILGSDYVWVTGTIAGTATPPALPLETQANGTKRGPDASSGQSKKPRLS